MRTENRRSGKRFGTHFLVNGGGLVGDTTGPPDNDHLFFRSTRFLRAFDLWEMLEKKTKKNESEFYLML